MTSNSDASIAKMIGYVPEKLMIIDPRVGKLTGHEERAQLRSIPMLVDLDITDFTYSHVWDPDIKLVNYQYHILHEEDVTDLSSSPAHIVSQKVENNTNSLLTRRIVQSNWQDPLIMVTDTDTFHLQNAKGNRSVAEDYGFQTVQYTRLFEKYLQKFHGIEKPAIGVSKTRNAIYHKMAQLHRDQNYEVTTLSDLFDFPDIPEKSQAWDILLEFCNHRGDVLEYFDDYIRENLRPWTERGEVGDITTSILDMLQTCDFERGKVLEHRGNKGES